MNYAAAKNERFLNEKGVATVTGKIESLLRIAVMFTTLLRLPSSSAQQCHYSASLSLADQTRRGIVFFPV